MVRAQIRRIGFFHLDVEDCSEELLRQQSYAIMNQLEHPKPPTRDFRSQKDLTSLFACSWLVLYGIRGFHIGFGGDELVLYGIRLLAQQLLGTVLDIEVDHTA